MTVLSADVNECSLQTDNCSSNAYCTDTEGSYNCTCNFGYIGDGLTCCKRTTIALKKNAINEVIILVIKYIKLRSSLFYTLNPFLQHAVY